LSIKRQHHLSAQPPHSITAKHCVTLHPSEQTPNSSQSSGVLGCLHTVLHCIFSIQGNHLSLQPSILTERKQSTGATECLYSVSRETTCLSNPPSSQRESRAQVQQNVYIQYPGRPPVSPTLHPHRDKAEHRCNRMFIFSHHHHHGSAAEQNRTFSIKGTETTPVSSPLLTAILRSNTRRRAVAKVLNWPSCCDRAQWRYCSIQASGSVIQFVCP
jgi:hypothetical protein